MPTPEELWEAYFFPDTYDRTTGAGTLRNLLGERDRAVLARQEYARTARRQRQLLAGEVDVARTFDADHARAIHRHLFQDVYDWAGQYRTVNIFKGTSRGFADVAGGEIDRYLTDVRRLVEAAPWDRLGQEEFAQRAATVFAYLNQAHPFREGNGRTSKVFMEHVAQRSGFTFDYSQVTPQEWNDASKYSGPDLFVYEPQPASLLPVFRQIAVPRSSAAALGVPDAARQARDALSASYPHPAGAAVQQPPQSTPEARRGSGHTVLEAGHMTPGGDTGDRPHVAVPDPARLRPGRHPNL